jgi:hypothetical protein
VNAPALLDEIHNLGVTLEARGDLLRFKPVHALPPVLLAALRSQKREILALIKNEQATGNDVSRAREPFPEITPFQRLEVDWQAAITRAREGFARNAMRPSHGCLEAAAAIELGLTDGTLTKHDAAADDVRGWLEEVYTGLSVARLTASGRITLRSVPTNWNREGD